MAVPNDCVHGPAPTQLIIEGDVPPLKHGGRVTATENAAILSRQSLRLTVLLLELLEELELELELLDLQQLQLG